MVSDFARKDHTIFVVGRSLFFFFRRRRFIGALLCVIELPKHDGLLEAVNAFDRVGAGGFHFQSP